MNDIGFESPFGPVCRFDSENGVMKPPEVIFQGGVEFFSGVVGGDRALAERLTRRNMKTLPYWHTHHFGLLDGATASDEEYRAAMAGL